VDKRQCPQEQLIGIEAVRPLPANERAIVAMGVAALATRAVSRRGRLIKQRPL
jgi:hypothetical protein